MLKKNSASCDCVDFTLKQVLLLKDIQHALWVYMVQLVVTRQKNITLADVTYTPFVQWLWTVRKQEVADKTGSGYVCSICFCQLGKIIILFKRQKMLHLMLHTPSLLTRPTNPEQGMLVRSCARMGSRKAAMSAGNKTARGSVTSTNI